MTIKASSTGAWVLGLGLVLTTCGSAQPCSSCVAIGGAYTMSWTHTSTACPLVNPEPATITLGQVNSNLTVLLGALTLSGTFYDSYDFTLGGFSGTTQYAMRGYAVPGIFADAGAQNPVTLNGTLTTSDLQSDAGCVGTDSFVGTRN